LAAFYADESFALPVVETRLATAIDVAVRSAATLAGSLIRVNRPA
jgi:hypothetical protein